MDGKLKGDLLRAYSQADAADIGFGYECTTEDGMFGKRVWKLLKQVGATAVTATTAKGLGVTSTLLVGATPDLSFTVALSATLGARNWAGARQPAVRGGVITAPEDLTQNTWGYFLVRGVADMMLGNAAPACVANDMVMNDDAAGGGRIGGVAAATLAETLGMIGFAVAASAGVTDEAVRCMITRNVWGAY